MRVSVAMFEDPDTGNFWWTDGRNWWWWWIHYKTVDSMIGEIPCICKSMLRSPVLLDGLRMYISDDPKIIKELTNMAVVKLPSAEKVKDLGNYCYNCLFHALVEIARGKNLDIYSDFARLGNKWPTLARKWQASERY